MRYYLMAVFGAPLALWPICLGCGLACERLLRLRLSNPLVLVLGLCVALVLIYPGYAAGAGDALAIALLAAVALGGLALARGGLRTRLNPGWAGMAGVAVYALYMLPVIAYGHWTWSGYDFVNDTAFELLLANHVKGFGAVLGNIPETSEREFLRAYLSSGYPLGTQALLGTLSGIAATDVAVLYQGFIASLAALGAVALSVAARGLLGLRRAAIAGFAAVAANLTYQYALQGGVKEIGLLAIVCAGVAFGCEAISLKAPYRAAALLALVAAAALAAYNAVAAPFLGALVLCLGAGVLLVRRCLPHIRWAGPVAVGAGAACVLAIPSLLTFSTFFNIARADQGSTGIGSIQFGQLLRALPLSQVSGVWLAGEYRLPIASHHAGLLTALASAVVLLALVPALAWALWRRDAAIPMAIGTVGLVLLVVFPRVSPYGQGKLLAICSPLVVFGAFVWLLGLRRRPLLLLGTPIAGLLLLGIAASDLLAYGFDRVAPTAQIEAIREVGKRFRGQGPVEWNEFQEYAKYLAREAKISAPFEALTPQQVKLRIPGPFYGYAFDLDQELLSFVEGYPIVVLRLSPAASRPPANYRLAYRNAYYEAWERTARPRVLEHLPLQRLYSPSAPVECHSLERLVARAPSGAELVEALAPEVSWFEAASDRSRSAGWNPVPAQPGAVETRTAGHAEGAVSVRRAGSYAVWVQGDFPRAVHVEVDHRRVGSVSGSNTPKQWLQAASLWLAAGRHTLRVVKQAGRRHFGPGEWGIGLVGAVALRRQEPERLRALPVSRYRALCGTQADWVELVRP